VGSIQIKKKEKRDKDSVKIRKNDRNQRRKITRPTHTNLRLRVEENLFIKRKEPGKKKNREFFILGSNDGGLIEFFWVNLEKTKRERTEHAFRQF